MVLSKVSFSFFVCLVILQPGAETWNMGMLFSLHRYVNFVMTYRLSDSLVTCWLPTYLQIPFGSKPERWDEWYWNCRCSNWRGGIQSGGSGHFKQCRQIKISWSCRSSNKSAGIWWCRNTLSSIWWWKRNWRKSRWLQIFAHRRQKRCHLLSWWIHNLIFCFDDFRG